jgi:hypothetical protein
VRPARELALLRLLPVRPLALLRPLRLRARPAPLVEAVLTEPMPLLAAPDVVVVAAAVRRSRRQWQSRAPSGTAKGSPT